MHRPTWCVVGEGSGSDRQRPPGPGGRAVEDSRHEAGLEQGPPPARLRQPGRRPPAPPHQDRQARARCSAVEPLRTAACHPSARALAATRPASRPMPSAESRPSTSPHATPHVRLARHARSTSAPPGGGVIASTFPRPRRATTAWADTPHGPSQVTTAPALDRHAIAPAAGRQRRSGAGSPRAPAAPSPAGATAGATGTSPGNPGPSSRRAPIPGATSATASTRPAGRMPAARSISAIASAAPASQRVLPGALSRTIAWTCSPVQSRSAGRAAAEVRLAERAGPGPVAARS